MLCIDLWLCRVFDVAWAFLQLRCVSFCCRAPLVAELWALCPQELQLGAQWPPLRVVHGPHCSAARGILPDPGSNVCLLPWQADSSPLSHQGSPEYFSKCLLATYIYSLKKWLKAYASILPQTPLPSRLPHNSGQSSRAVQKVLVMVHFKFSSVYMSTQHSKD